MYPWNCATNANLLRPHTWSSAQPHTLDHQTSGSRLPSTTRVIEVCACVVWQGASRAEKETVLFGGIVLHFVVSLFWRHAINCLWFVYSFVSVLGHCRWPWLRNASSSSSAPPFVDCFIRFFSRQKARIKTFYSLPEWKYKQWLWLTDRLKDMQKRQACT